jgi:predicted enzyme related to lactoylglutathione lyase
MQTNFLGLRTCIFKVKDLEATKNWYAKVLGFAPYFDEVFYVGFEVGGYELGLQPIDNEELILGSNVNIYWGVAEVASHFQRLLNLGATAHEAPQEVGGGIIVATVKDPFGNLFGLIYNPHFKLA